MGLEQSSNGEMTRLPLLSSHLKVALGSPVNDHSAVVLVPGEAGPVTTGSSGTSTSTLKLTGCENPMLPAASRCSAWTVYRLSASAVGAATLQVPLSALVAVKV